MDLIERMKAELAHGDAITTIVYHMVMQDFDPADVTAALQANGFAVVNMAPTGLYYSQDQFEDAREREHRETLPLSTFDNYIALPK